MDEDAIFIYEWISCNYLLLFFSHMKKCETTQNVSFVKKSLVFVKLKLINLMDMSSEEIQYTFKN